VVLAAMLVVAAAAAAPTLEECNSQKDAWVKQYVRLSTDLHCFNASLPAETVGHSIVCGQQECLAGVDAAHMAAQALHTACTAVADYVDPPAAALLAAVAGEMHTMCNQCVLAYEAYKRVNVSWHGAGCPSKLGTAAVCSADCLDLARDMVDRWTIMIPSGLCKQYNPGAQRVRATVLSVSASVGARAVV
jgi:hypothetical protein